MQKPQLGVSACLLGQQVRYDGRSKPLAKSVITALQAQARIIALCPEVGCGLSVPRPPVRLVVCSGGIRALGVEKRHLDVTDCLQAWLRRQDTLLAELDALLLKAKSPSCGRDSVPLWHPNGTDILRIGDGFLPAHVRKHHPELALFTEHEWAACLAFLQTRISQAR